MATLASPLLRRYGVAITWDPVDYAKPVDLDLQAIIIDKRGYIEAWQVWLKEKRTKRSVCFILFQELVGEPFAEKEKKSAGRMEAQKN